jgi:hypothetical protein
MALKMWLASESCGSAYTEGGSREREQDDELFRCIVVIVNGGDRS